MKTVVLGTGSWGTALAQILADNGQEVCLYGIDQKQIDDINNNHHNSVFFEAEINHDLKAYNSMDCVKTADIILLAVPSIAIESTLQKACEYLTKPVIVINVAKGFHPVTHERLSIVIKRVMPADKCKAVVSLIGPSHAEEVIIRMLTVVNAVSDNEEAAKEIQKLFSNNYFRVYRNTDVVGAEIGVAAKNVIALASGMLSGIGQGDNARAALMTRALAEITRYGIALGGKMETFLGLDGVGDLIVTCTSHHSRNFTAGYEIGSTGDAATFLKNNKKTVEGISACRIIHEDAQKLNINMPITDAVYSILFEGLVPAAAIDTLMTRNLKSES